MEAGLSTFPAEPNAITEGFLRRGWPLRLLLFIAIAVAAHLLLSRLGFNPTDDGFILAQSRRILDGQVPHRDFISIRPVGSAVLHTVELVLGGRHAFLLSRLFYWIQAATLCWCWMEIALRRSSTRPSLLGVAPLAALSFMLTTHGFSPMAWHTVDGVWLASLGGLACMGPSQGWRLAGYVLIGAAVTCKQNFLPLLPVAILANGDLRRPTAWLAVAAPALVYLAVLLALGASGDMRQQLFAFSELMGPGVKRYLAAPGWPTGVVVGTVATFLSAHEPRADIRSSALGSRTPWVGFLVLLIAIGSIGWTLDAKGFLYLDHMSFALLGCLCGFLLAMARQWKATSIVSAAALLAVLAWCSSISFGYQTPAHVAGPIASLLLVAGSGGLLAAGHARARTVAIVLLWLVTSAVAGHWWSARRDHIYHEATAPMLTAKLDGVLAGAAGVRTNPNTFEVLSDLRGLVDQLNGRRYALVVDFPGWWAKSAQANPSPTDWPQSIELCTEGLQDRFSSRMVALRGNTVFVVQKVQATTLADGFIPVGNDNLYYGAAVWIRHTFRKVGETRFWDLYE